MLNDDLFTTVTVNDREFRIKRFDARTGLKLARLVIAKAAPLIPALDKLDKEQTKGKKPAKAPGNAASANDDEGFYKMIGRVLEDMSDDDLDTLIDKCLRVCYVALPAGLQPVIDEVGNYGVEGIEYDMGLTLRLCFEAIKWGASDFFAGNSSLSNLFQK